MDERAPAPPRDPRAPLSLQPIGVLRSPHRERFDAPRQPRAAEGVEGTIELFPGHGYEDALADLEAWPYVWVLGWFDRNTTWKPKVTPPRSRVKRGVFSTRAPHRPNPISLSVFRLLGVDGLSVRVANVDLLDGTPILDLKPYVPWTDAIADADAGWLVDEARDEVAGAVFEVGFGDDARLDLAFLASHGVELTARIEKALALGPAPHAYRRIKVVGHGFVLGVMDYRAWFVVEGRVVTVVAIRSGVKPRKLETDPAYALHAALEARHVDRGTLGPPWTSTVETP